MSAGSLSGSKKQRQISDALREDGRAVLSSLPDRDSFLERVMDRLNDLTEISEEAKDYIFEIASIADLEKGELDRLLKERVDKSKGPKAKRRLNEANLRLVVWIAKDYASADLLVMDLINEGTVGLIQAVDTYEGNGFTFREYVSCVVKETISFAVAEETRSLRVPKYILEKINAVKGVTRKLAEKKGSEPSYDEIAEAMGLQLEELERLVGLAKVPARAEDDESGDDESVNERLDNSGF